MLRVQKYKRSNDRIDDTKRVMVSFLFFFCPDKRGPECCVNKPVAMEKEKKKEMLFLQKKRTAISKTLLCTVNTFIYGVLLLETSIKNTKMEIDARCIFIEMLIIFGGFLTKK